MTPDLRTQLGRFADATDPASDPIDLGELVSRRAGRRRAQGGPLALRVAAGLLVVGVLAAVVVAMTSDREDAEHLYSAVAPTASETANADLLGPGEVRALPPAPLEGRFGAATAWTGKEVFVWGGDDESLGRNFADGATFDVRRNEWSLLPPSPLRARGDASAVWTGTEVLVWGGFASKGLSEGEDPERSDGAAYDPATETWRAIADAPISGDSFARAVWTGEEMVVLTGRDPAAGAAYDPAEDEWRRIADPPMPLAQAHPQATWTGERVVASLGSNTVDVMGLYAYDPAEDRWEEYDQPSGAARADRVVWAGDRLLQVPVDRAPEARDPATGRWAVAGDPPPAIAETTRRAPLTLWTGRRAVVWGPGFVAAFDPGRGTWTVTGQDRQPTDADSGVSAVWADGVLFVWGGFPAVAEGALIRPADPESTTPTDPERSDQQGGVAPEALDLLAPVDREAFQNARSRLNRAVWETVEAEWSTCARGEGLVVDSELGYELSFLSNVAAYDFMAPSVIREQGGAGRSASAAVAELTTEEVASIDRCNGRVQSVLEGQRPEADLDDSRAASARRALEILGSGASTFPRLYAEVERRVDMGEWGSVVECLRGRHLDVPDAVADSPMGTLDVLGAAVDGSQSPAEVARLVTEVQPQLDAYIDCAAAFYDGLSAELTRFRAEALGSNEPAFVELSEALDVLNA